MFTELLKDAGLTDVQVRTVAFDHEVASPNQLWDGMLGGTYERRRSLLPNPTASGPGPTPFDRRVEDYRRGDHLELPISVMLAAGWKPPAD